MLISLCWKKRIPSVVGPYLKIILSLQNMVYHYEYVTIILGNRFAMNAVADSGGPGGPGPPLGKPKNVKGPHKRKIHGTTPPHWIVPALETTEPPPLNRVGFGDHGTPPLNRVDLALDTKGAASLGKSWIFDWNVIFNQTCAHCPPALSL